MKRLLMTFALLLAPLLMLNAAEFRSTTETDCGLLGPVTLQAADSLNVNPEKTR